MGRDPRPRWWIGVPVAAVLALAAVVVVVWLGGASHEAARSDGGARAATGPVVSASAGVGGDPWTHLAEATRAADATPVSDPCGWAALRTDDGADEAQKRRSAERLRLAQDTLARRLSSAPDELGRLLAAHLANQLPRVLDIAGHTRDPVVFGVGRLICGAGTPGSDCAGTLSASRWVALDPDNAAAWWAVAAETQDRAEILAALTRASAAGHVVPVRGVAMRRLALENAVPLSAAYQLGIGYEGLQSALTPAPLRAMDQICGKGETEAREVCKATALHVLRLAPDLGDKLMALGLATRWGALPDEMAYSRKQLHASVQTMLRVLKVELPASDGARPAPDARAECGRIRAEIDFLSLASEVGELEALRRLSGDPALSPYSATPPRSR